jgi:ribonucleotide reductase alpha subunit
MILSEKFLKPYKTAKPPFGFNGLGHVVYRRTYSRFKEDGQLEDWWETLQRCVEGAQKIGAEYTVEEAEKLYNHLFNLRCSFAGRSLWQFGAPTLDKLGAASLLNCWFVPITKPYDFCFLFDNLMLGGGCGFSIRRQDVHELPRVKRGVSITHQKCSDADFIVPDSREGWVRLLRRVLRSYFETGTSFNYSTILVRPRGERIAGFGGIASGPINLIEGVESICKVLRAREGKKLRSIDALDICNIIGSIVVSGNVRRSAEVALFDPDDVLLLRAKRWDLGDVPNFRAMSNNSLYADSYDHIMDHVWQTYEGNGEALGLFNLPLAQSQGRLGEERDDNCEGANPCMEVPLAPYECCNLAELFLNNIESPEQLYECARLLYKTQKAIAAAPYHHPETNRVVHRNMRLGLGATGICQVSKKLEWLDKCYRDLRKFDREWSKKRGWPESIKLTTIKPSGTLSLLAGSTPGCHPAYSQYYLRRVRLSSSDSLIPCLREAGYNVTFQENQDGSVNRDTLVVEFPCEAGEGAKLASDMTAVDQLELVKKLQTIWADNAVSVTIYYEHSELDAIRAWLKEHYASSIKSVSFLLKQGHNFKQAPYEAIDKTTYDMLMQKIKPIKNISQGELIEEECAGGKCPVR